MQRDTEAATSYHELLVPALMNEWAPRVAAAAGIRSGDRVLDVACGTGVLARAAASRAGATGAVTGLDLSPGMLTVAARVSPGLRWQQGTAEALPFPDQSFDVVVSQFGLMFFPDRVGALREMMRVLTPGGRIAIAVWGSLAETPAYAAEVALVDRLAGATAADALRSPFVLGEPPRMRELFDAASIAGARIVSQPGRGRFVSTRVMLEADLRGWLPIVGVVLPDDLIEEILRQAETEVEPFVSHDASGITFASPAVLATAVKPPSP